MIPLPAPPDAWQATAGRLRLPLLDGTRAAVSRLGRGPALRAERLARIAADDPCLALELLRAAGAATRRRADAPAMEDGIETVSHGVTLVGVERAVELALKLPRVAAIQDAPRRIGLLETIGTAHLAGHLAEHWAERAGRRSPEAHRLAAQTCFLGDLAAWQTGGPGAPTLSAVERDPDPDRGAAEQRALGARLSEIGAAIAGAWDLPLLARDALAIAPGGNQRASGAALAARLARAAARGWYEPATVQAVESLAQRLGIDPALALTVARQATAAAARSFFDPRRISPARRLPLLPGERVEPEWLVEPAPAAAQRSEARPAREPRPGPRAGRAPRAAPAKPSNAAPQAPPPPAPKAAATPAPPAGPAAAPATVPAAAPAPAAARERFRPCLEALAGYAEGRLSAHDSLHALVRGMRTALGFRRVALAMLSPDRKLLIGRFSSEDNDRQFLSRFRVDMSDEHLLWRLMQRQQSVMMDEGNRGQVLPRLPAGVRTLIAEDGFCAMSLFVRDRPVGLFYGHWTRPEAAGNRRRDYEHFKRLCTRTGRALEKSAA